MKFLAVDLTIHIRLYVRLTSQVIHMSQESKEANILLNKGLLQLLLKGLEDQMPFNNSCWDLHWWSESKKCFWLISNIVTIFLCLISIIYWTGLFFIEYLGFVPFNSFMVMTTSYNVFNISLILYCCFTELCGGWLHLSLPAGEVPRDCTESRGA